MSTGSMRERSPGRWQLKFDVGRAADGRRQTRYVTIRGTRADARRELRRRLTAIDEGRHVDKSSATVGAFVAERVATWACSPRTREGYEQLARLIARYLGAIPLQRLTTLDIERWHSQAKVAPSTLRAAHGVLTRALSDAVKHRLVNANLAREQRPPKVTTRKVKVPTEDLIGPMLEALRGSEFHAPAVVTVYCGIRRGELLALRWCDVVGSTMTIARAIEEAGGGITIKPPKTEDSERTLTVPTAALEALREHRRQQLERRMLLGQGKPPDNALMFPGWAGGPQSPRAFSVRWRRTVQRLKLPVVTWHGLRHLHGSLLLRHNVDLATVSKRLGHSRVSTTARIYLHAVTKDDRHAADALDKALGQ